MTTRFGFDDAGVGFDQAPFASIYADVLIEAGKTLPAFSTSATVQKRAPTRLTASQTFPASSSTARCKAMTAYASLEASATFPAFSYAPPIVSKDRFIDVCEEITIAEPDIHSATVLEWSNTFPTVPTDYVEGGGSSILTLISFRTGSGLSAINIFGSSLISDWENAPNAIQFTANGNTVVIGGPNAPDNFNLDPDAPYSWNMGQTDRDELAAWLATYTGGPVTMGFCGGGTLVSRNIIADKTFSAFTAAATMQTRGGAPARHEIQAALTFPAVTSTATVDNRAASTPCDNRRHHVQCTHHHGDGAKPHSNAPGANRIQDVCRAYRLCHCPGSHANAQCDNRRRYVPRIVQHRHAAKR